MKIAAFHNFMDNIGGAELFALHFSKLFGADLYTTRVDYDKIRLMGFDPIIASIGSVPLNAPWRQQIAYWKFRKFKTPNPYDCSVVVGDWAMSVGVLNKPNIWYSHSPTREIWDLCDYTRENTVPRYARGIFDLWAGMNRRNYLRDVEHIDKIISNSLNVRNRIWKFLKRDSEVIHPPTDVNRFFYRKNGDFWLSVNRLISHKRIIMQLEAFRSLKNQKLIIVGCYEQANHFQDYAKKILQMKPTNIEIRSWISAEELSSLYADCRGLIATGFNEDFGMTPVEAMASGKPVIAPDEGGYRETVVHRKTGILIKDIDSAKLASAVRSLDGYVHQYREDCLLRANEFSLSSFQEKFKEHLPSG